MSDYYYHHYTYHLEIKMEIEPLQKDEEIVECPNCKTRLKITQTAYICPNCGWDVKCNVQTQSVSEIGESRETDKLTSTDILKNLVRCSCGLTFYGPRFGYKCPKCFRQHQREY